MTGSNPRLLASPNFTGPPRNPIPQPQLVLHGMYVVVYIDLLPAYSNRRVAGVRDGMRCRDTSPRSRGGPAGSSRCPAACSRAGGQAVRWRRQPRGRGSSDPSGPVRGVRKPVRVSPFGQQRPSLQSPQRNLHSHGIFLWRMSLFTFPSQDFTR